MLSVICDITRLKRIRKVRRPVSWLIFTALFTLLHSHLANSTPLTSALTNIKDPNLRLCIEKLAQKKNWSETKEVTKLKCHNKGITSLNGLHTLSDIETLSLHKNKITEFDPSLFPKLRVLNLGRNKLEQLTIEGLTKLEELYIFNNRLTLLTLNNLDKLKKLKANSNKIEQFSYSDLPWLSKIYLFDNNMEDIDITSLPGMKYMDVRQNPMPDELYERMDAMNATTILHDGNADDWN